MGSSQEDLESRFANLLQPIRDLTKNWDVDIASSLEDYLEEVCQHILQIYPALFFSFAVLIAISFTSFSIAVTGKIPLGLYVICMPSQ